MSCCGGDADINLPTGPSRTARAILALKEAGADFNNKNLFGVAPTMAAAMPAGALPNLVLNIEQLNALYTSAETNFSLTLPGKNSEVYTLLLKEVLLYNPEFHVIDGNGNILDAPKGRHYFGIVEGRENSSVVLNIYPNEVAGIIKIDNDPIQIVKETVADTDMYQMRLQSLEPSKTFACTTDTSLQLGNSIERQISAQVVSNNCARIYFDVDNSITDFFGGNTTNTTAYVTSVFASVAGTYLNDPDVEVTLFLSSMTVYTSAPPFVTDLNGYGQYRTTNPVAGVGIYNFVHFNSLSGVAWVGTFCSTPSGSVGPYSICGLDSSATAGGVNPPYPSYSWSTAVVAHEMGHSFGSRHTFDCVWNGPTGPNQSLGGCATTSGPCVGCTAANPSGTCFQPGSAGYVYTSANGSTGLSGFTIMGYCNGSGSGAPLFFGPQPGAVIRAAVDGCTGCILCLDATTSILLPNGTTKMICELKRGDYVAGNIENTKSYRISKVNIASYFPDQEIATVVFAPNCLGENMPSQELRMTEGHPIFYNGCRRSARCFKNFPGVTFSPNTQCQDIFQISKEGMVYVYDLQFDDDGSYVANGVMVQSRCPWSIVTPLEKYLYFDRNMYREERTGDSLNHTVPRDWNILECNQSISI